MISNLTVALALIGGDTTLVLDRNDIAVESIAYDPRERQFYAGDLARGKIVRFDRRGRSRIWFEAPGYSVLGLKVDQPRRRLWACVISSDRAAKDRSRSALLAIALDTGRLAGRWVPRDSLAAHLFNDLVVTPDGAIYLTDSEASRVYRLRSGADTLDSWFAPPAAGFEYPNGITTAASPDTILVAHQSGVTMVTETAGKTTGLPLGGAPPGLDGLYYHQGTLVGVDNSRKDRERVVAQPLRGTALGPIVTLAERKPGFAIPTTGVMVGDTLFYIANSQLDQVDRQATSAHPRFNPLIVLQTVVRR